MVIWLIERRGTLKSLVSTERRRRSGLRSGVDLSENASETLFTVTANQRYHLSSVSDRPCPIWARTGAADPHERGINSWAAEISADPQEDKPQVSEFKGDMYLETARETRD